MQAGIPEYRVLDLFDASETHLYICTERHMAGQGAPFKGEMHAALLYDGAGLLSCVDKNPCFGVWVGCDHGYGGIGMSKDHHLTGSLVQKY